MAIELSTPSFKPREYEGEYIRYTLYGLDSGGDELDDLITSPKKSTVTHTIKELLPDYGRVYNGMHVVAILYDKNDRRLDSEVVWSKMNQKAPTKPLNTKRDTKIPVAKMRRGLSATIRAERSLHRSRAKMPRRPISPA